MRVIVCGGRNFKDKSYAHKALDALHEKYHFSCVITGGAKGVDKIAHAWAVDRKIPTQTYPAEWTKHGPAAGPIRNAKMLKEGKPNLVIALPGGKGTKDMMQKALAANIRIVEVDDWGFFN